MENTETNEVVGPRYLFGGSGADTITGGDYDDHLYGGGGAGLWSAEVGGWLPSTSWSIGSRLSAIGRAS